MAIGGIRYKFLADSGASISLIKSSCVPTKVPVYSQNVIKLRGVNGEIPNKGCADIDMIIGGMKVNQRMCIVDSISCAVDGILGVDFLDKMRALIDFAQQCIRFTDSNVKIKMHSINEVCVSLIEKRCEQIILVEVDEKCDLVVMPKEVCKGVFSAGMIVRPSEGKIPVKLLNVNDNEVELNNFKPELVRLDQFEQMNFEKIRNTKQVSRVEKVLNSVKLDHLNKEERSVIEKLIVKYNDLFFLDSDHLTVTNLFQQNIPLRSDAVPSYVKPYRVPHAQKKEIKEQTDKMLQDGIIEPSISEWSSPLLLVPKKKDVFGNKRWRLVVDFRLVNKTIVDDRFQLPNITEILDSLAGAVYFTHLDLAQGYYQLELEKESRKITAFTTPEGQFQLKRLPMGLKISPSAFSRMMTIAMSGLNYQRCFVYLDDLIVFGKNLGDHNKNLQLVLNRLREVNLKLNVDKCQFLKKSIVYLGHTISERGVEPDPDKIEAILRYPVPTNVEETKRFVAMVNYYRNHIKEFAHISLPLNKLSRKDVPFEWSIDCEEAFKKLKAAITSHGVLDFPDFSEENIFQLTTDASGYAMGCVLANGNNRPIAFASRALNKAELGYSTIEKELLAIVWGVQHFKPYVMGRKFIVNTDHRPLVHLFSMVNPYSRLLKFRLILEEYDFEVLYVKGKDNVVADALSRITVEDLKNLQKEVVNAVTRSMTAVKEDVEAKEPELETTPNRVQLLKPPNDGRLVIIKDDPRYKSGMRIDEDERIIHINWSGTRDDIDSIVEEIDNFLRDKEGRKLTFFRNDKSVKFVKHIAKRLLNSDYQFIFVNEQKVIEDHKEKRIILNDFHQLPTGGHAGVNRMFNNIARRYTWVGLYKDVKSYVANCLQCKKCKVHRHMKAPLEITSTATESFQKVFLDIVGPLPEDEYGNKYILTIQCELTKFVEAYPLKTKESDSVAAMFVDEFVLRFGVPKVIATDLGTEFTSNTFRTVCEMLQVKQLNSTAYHHESIGALENSHKQLGSFLKIWAGENQTNWTQWVPYWTFAHNNTVHSATGYTPTELVFGKITNLPSNLMESIDPIYNFDSYINELKYRLRVAWMDARDNLIGNKKEYKKIYDRRINIKEIKVNDRVLLINYARKTKLEPYYKGPFIVRAIELPNIIIDYYGKIKPVHINNVKLI